VLLLGLLAVGAVAFVGFRSVHDFKQQTADAGVRASRARAVLGVDAFPPGYHAGVGRSIPPVFEMAVLFDRPLDGGRVSPRTERMFLYAYWKRGGPDWDSYLEGNADPGALLAEHGFDLERGRPVARDRFAIGAAEAKRASHLGTLSTGDGQRLGGLVTTLLIDCPEDDRVRMAFWVGPAPDPAQTTAETDLTGSVADRDEIRTFLSRFGFCP